MVTLEHRVSVARARRFLGAHLGEAMPLGAIARAAGASVFHLARLHRALTGETLGRARTRLRIERAAAALVAEPTRAVTAIALDVGFRTPSAFGKAFRAALGMAPSAFRAAGVAERRRALRALTPRRTARYDLSGPRRVRGAALRVVYVRERGAYGEVAAPLAWSALARCLAGTPLADAEKIGASYGDPDALPADALRYDAGVIAPPGAAAPPGTQLATWAGGAYAAFELRGEYRFIADAFRRIAVAWPAFGLTARDAPYLERYRPGVTELWVPIAEACRAA